MVAETSTKHHGALLWEAFDILERNVRRFEARGNVLIPANIDSILLRLIHTACTSRPEVIERSREVVQEVLDEQGF